MYCHPSRNSFTYKVCEEFSRGLKAGGHDFVMSDLYEMDFNETMSEAEYLREGFYVLEKSVPDDVLAEQKKIQEADAIAFIYPVFWTEAPAKLVGWFQRVWTYGYAYGVDSKMKKLDKALFLVTMGGSLNDAVRQKEAEAMKTVMIGDRMFNRANSCEMIVFDGMTRGYGNDDNRNERGEKFLAQAFEKGKNLFK